MTGELTAGPAIRALSETTGEQYELVGRLAGGETGAHRVRGPAGEQLVVKWAQTPRARDLRREGAILSERLRTGAGWPVPRVWTVDGEGVLFVLQTFMPGRPPESIDAALVEEVLALHDRRVGLAGADDRTRWPERLITTLTEGGDGYCRHESLRTYDRRTADLLARIRKFGASLTAADFGGADVVHWDLHPGNLLVDEAVLAAVVDTDFTMVGDGAFDLVMFAVTTATVRIEPTARDRLRDAALGDRESVRAQAYLAHLFLRLLDWPIQRGAPGEVDFWLEQAGSLLTI